MHVNCLQLQLSSRALIAFAKSYSSFMFKVYRLDCQTTCQYRYNYLVYKLQFTFSKTSFDSFNDFSGLQLNLLMNHMVIFDYRKDCHLKCPQSCQKTKFFSQNFFLVFQFAMVYPNLIFCRCYLSKKISQQYSGNLNILPSTDQ